MALYSVTAPNGRTYEIEGPEGATDAQIVAALLAYDPDAGRPPPPRAPVRESTFLGEAIRGIKQPLSSMRTGAASLMGSPAEAAGAGLERAGQIAEAAGEGPSFERVGRVYSERGLLPAIGQAVSDIPKAIAGQSGTIGTALAGAKLGALAGAPFGGPPGALIGAGLGGAAALVPSMFGSNIERQAAEQREAGEPIEPQLGRAGAAAAGQAALEAGGLAVTLGRRVIGGLLGIAPQVVATDAAKQKLLTEAARTIRGGVVRGAAVEIPVEIAQSVIERAQAGLDITSPEALKEYGEAAYLAGLVGGPFGGVGAAVSRAGAQRELSAMAPPVAEPVAVAAEPAAVAAEPVAVAAEPAAVAAEPAAAPAEPAAPGEIIVTRELLAELGLPLKPKTLQQKGVAEWMDKNAVGRSLSEVADLVKQNPDLVKGAKLQATILKKLSSSAITVPPFVEPAVTAPIEETARDLAIRPDVPESPGVEPGGRISGVGVSEGVRGQQPIADVAPQPAAPVPGRVAPVESPIAAGDVSEVAAPAPVARPAAPPREVDAVFELRPFLRADVVPPAVSKAALQYVQRMREDGAAADNLPRYLGWDLFNGSKFDPQTNQFTRIGFSPKDGIDGTSATAQALSATARALYNGLNPAAQQQVQEEAKKFVAQTEAGAAARERMDLKQIAQRAEAPPEVDLEDIPDDYGLDILAARGGADARPRVTEIPGGRRVQGVRYQERTSGAEVPLTPDAIAELEGNNVAAALRDLAETTTNPAYKALAERLIPLLRNTKVNIEPELLNKEGDRAAGAASTSGNTIWLDRELGLNEETLLHESVHAATERILAAKPADRTAVQNVAVRELNALWEAAKADSAVKLTPDARGKLSEFVTEALTNPELVQQLKAKPWTIKDAWESFKTILLKAIGVKFPTNAYEAAMASMDTIFSPTLPRSAAQAEAPARFQAAPRTVEETLAEMRRAPEKQSLRAMISGAFGGPGKGPAGANNDYVADFWTRSRTRISDRAATVFDSLNNAVSKEMISAMESRATQVAFKQAEASNQMLPAFFRSGVIKRDPVGGWVVGDPAGAKTAPAEVLPLVEAWGKKRGLSMNDAWADAARLMESGRQYVFREHNRNRAPDDPELPVSMKDAQIDTLYPAYKADEDLAKIKEILDKVRFRLVDQMVEVGRIDADTAKEWKEASEYIPFDRLSDKELGRYEGARFRKKKTVGKGLSALGGLPELVDAGWANRPVGNALENYFGTLGWMMQQVVRTDALNTTLAQLEKIGQAKDAGKVRPPSHKPSARTYRDGQEHFYTVPTIYHAMAFNMQVAPLPKFLEIFGQVSRVLRTSITALPTFTASQLPQDIQRAIIYSGVKDPAALAAKAFANFTALSRQALKGTLPTATPVLSASGVVGDVDFRSDKPGTSLLQEFGYESPTLLKSKAAGKILHRMNELARSGDVAVRQAIYDQTLEETKDRLLALQRAREYINFRTTGAGDTLGILPVMLQTIPFFNAYVQGMDVLFRAFTGRGAVSGLAAKQARAKFLTMAGSLAAFSTMYALAMAGDDEYENIPLDERDKTWVLGGGIGIPVPSEIGIIFKAIPERLVEATLKYGTPEEAAGVLALSSWFKTALKEYGGRLLPVPAAVKPLAEAWVNYSFFTGRELEGTYLKQLDPAQRITSATSEFAKEVVRFTEATGASRALKETLGVELSPIIVDNTLRGYFGTAAGFTLATVDAMFSSKADRPLHHYVGLGSFTYDPVGTRRSDEFYDMREKVTRAHQTLNALVERNPEQAMAYAEANKEKLIAYRAVNSALRQLEKTREYKNWLDTPAAAQQLPGAERLRQKQEVQKYEQELMSFARMARTELRF